MQLAGLLSLVQDIPAYAALRQRAEEGAALPPLAWVWFRHFSMFRKDCSKGACALPAEGGSPRPGSGA